MSDRATVTEAGAGLRESAPVGPRLRAAGRASRRPRRPQPWRRRVPSDDPFAGVAGLAESAEVIEDVPDAGESVQHVAGEIDVPDGYTVLEGTPSGHRRSVAVVVSRYNGGLTNRMLAVAIERWRKPGSSPDAVTIMPVPGAFELPLAAMALAKTRRYACVVALGAIVRGETPHFDYVAAEAASGPPARGDRDRRPGRLRRAHRRHRRAGRGADRPGRRRRAHGARDGRRVRAAARQRTIPRSTLADWVLWRRPCRRSAQSAERSPGSATTARTRWSPPTGGSTRTSSASACSSTASRAARYVCTRCLKGGKVQKAV